MVYAVDNQTAHLDTPTIRAALDDATAASAQHFKWKVVTVTPSETERDMCCSFLRGLQPVLLTFECDTEQVESVRAAMNRKKMAAQTIAPKSPTDHLNKHSA